MGVRHIEVRHEPGRRPLHDLLTGAEVDPASLALPESLVDRLDAWARRWEGAVDATDPPALVVERWVVDELGRDRARLWRAMLGLLPPHGFHLTYAHEGVRYTSVDELPVEWRFG